MNTARFLRAASCPVKSTSESGRTDASGSSSRFSERDEAAGRGQAMGPGCRVLRVRDTLTKHDESDRHADVRGPQRRCCRLDGSIRPYMSARRLRRARWSDMPRGRGVGADRRARVRVEHDDRDEAGTQLRRPDEHRPTRLHDADATPPRRSLHAEPSNQTFYLRNERAIESAILLPHVMVRRLRSPAARRIIPRCDDPVAIVEVLSNGSVGL